MPRSRATKPIKDIIGVILELRKMTDSRAVAISAGAFLEYTLSLALRSRLRELDKAEIATIFDNQGHGALATFSQKIWMGFALNLYDAGARRDLIALKEIRNHFAHGYH
jgi:hypothetical protein